MLQHKILRSDCPAGGAFDGTQRGRGREPTASTPVPDGLPGLAGRLGKLVRADPVQAEIFVKGHGSRVTRTVTRVNTLLRDSAAQTGYGSPMADLPEDPPAPKKMQYPNRLAELMEAKGLDGAELARMDGHTSRQQIHKLARGDRKLTRDWAERLAPHLGVEWPQLMGWRGDLAPAPKPVLISVGARLSWARHFHVVSLAAAAERTGIPIERLAEIEAGAAEMSLIELINLSTKLQIPPNFLLLGLVDDLPHKMALAWAQRRSPNPLSESPARTG